MEYTKGEWKVITNGNSLLAIASCHNDVTKNRNICSFEPLFLRGEKSSLYRQLGGEDEANAHLIAASPKLLEACNKMWSYLISRPAKPKELTDILMLCDKAIAKADGGK